MNIIICDDSQKDRETLIELLQDYAQERNESFEITEYDSGLRLCEDEDSLQKYQLVFLDINMEDMDGLKTAMKIKKEYPKLLFNCKKWNYMHSSIYDDEYIKIRNISISSPCCFHFVLYCFISEWRI